MVYNFLFNVHFQGNISVVSYSFQHAYRIIKIGSYGNCQYGSSFKYLYFNSVANISIDTGKVVLAQLFTGLVFNQQQTNSPNAAPGFPRVCSLYFPTVHAVPVGPRPFVVSCSKERWDQYYREY